jgi:hypothetical protein
MDKTLERAVLQAAELMIEDWNTKTQAGVPGDDLEGIASRSVIQGSTKWTVTTTLTACFVPKSEWEMV